MTRTWKNPPVLIVLIIIVGVIWFSLSPYTPERRDFSARLKAWHADCDAFVGQPLATLGHDGRVCKARLEGLTEDAREHGWMK